MDLENAFTYVEWPEWVWYYQAGPSVRVRDAPAEVRAEFAHLGSRARLVPIYKRLAMGDSHAVDVLLAIVLQRQVEDSIRSVLPNPVITFLIWSGWTEGRCHFWEIFAGTAKLSWKFAGAAGWVRGSVSCTLGSVICFQ